MFVCLLHDWYTPRVTKCFMSHIGVISADGVEAACRIQGCAIALQIRIACSPIQPHQLAENPLLRS